MAITIVSSKINIAGSYTSGTATSGTTTTLTKTGAGWTASPATGSLERRILWITGGTGAGQSRAILSNTSTVITIYPTHPFDTAPDATSTFAVGYDCTDIAAAAYGTWEISVTERALRIPTYDIHVPSGGYLGQIYGSIVFTTLDKWFAGDSGGNIQFGQLAGGRGLNGVLIQSSKNTATGWVTVANNARTKLYGCPLSWNKEEVEPHMYRWIQSGNDGIDYVDCTVQNTQTILTAADSAKYHKQYPLGSISFDGQVDTLGIEIVNSSTGQAEINQGTDIFDVSVIGNPGGIRPHQVIQSNATAQYGTSYWWNFKTDQPSYASDVFSWLWFPGYQDSNGDIWIGVTVGMTINDAAGSPIQSVRIGVKDKNGNNIICTGKAGTPLYGPTYSTSVATDSNGQYIGPFGTNEGLFIIRNKIECGNPTYAGYRTTVTNTEYFPYSMTMRKYGYAFQTVARNWDSRTIESNGLATNNFVVASEAAAAAYTGITINGAAKTVAVSGTRTIQELYDYSQDWASSDANLIYDEPLLTSDGINFVLASGWTLTVTGSLTSTTKQINSTVTVSGSGFYKDLLGVKWINTGVIYYASEVTYTFKDGATPKQYVWSAIYDDTGTNRLYNTSLANTEIESNASGVVTGYVVYKIDASTKTGHVLTARQYGYNRVAQAESYSGPAIIKDVLLAADSFITEATEATVAAFTGIALNYTAKTVTISKVGNTTFDNIYDFIRYSDSLQANIDETDTVSTADGSSYYLKTDWSLVISGNGTAAAVSVEQTAKVILTQGTGALSITNDGYYHSSLGARWEQAGSQYYASEVTYTFKLGGTPVPNVWAAVYESGGLNVLWNSSLTATELESNGSGVVTGYAVYKKDAVTYSGLTTAARQYGYQRIYNPETSNGVAIEKDVLMIADTFINEPIEATVAAYTGITQNHSTKSLGVTTANTIEKVYDYSKYSDALQANIDDADTLSTVDGNVYTLKSDWKITELGNMDYGANRLGGGTMVFTTATAYVPVIGTMTLEFTAASGTYDLRNADIDGTVTLINSGGGSITVQLPVGVAVVNTGPNITVEQSATVNITISGFSTTSRLQLYNVDDALELYNDVPGATFKTLAQTYTVDKQIRIRVADSGSGGADAKAFIETEQTMTVLGLTYSLVQVADTTYNANAVDGSGVTGMTIVPSPTRIEISIAGGSTSWPDIYAYQVYWLSTATGIADEAAFIDGVDTANYILTDFKIKNTHANALTITGGWGRDASTLTVAGCVDVAGSTGNIFIEPDHVVAFATGSALTAGESAALTAIKSVTDQVVFTKANEIDVNVQSINGVTLVGDGSGTPMGA